MIKVYSSISHTKSLIIGGRANFENHKNTSGLKSLLTAKEHRSLRK